MGKPIYRLSSEAYLVLVFLDELQRPAGPTTIAERTDIDQELLRSKVIPELLNQQMIGQPGSPEVYVPSLLGREYAAETQLRREIVLGPLKTHKAFGPAKETTADQPPKSIFPRPRNRRKR